MANYDFKCTNEECTKYNKIIEVSIDILEYDKASLNLYCKCCDSRLKRVYNSRVGLMFNGNGFYETDYKNKR